MAQKGEVEELLLLMMCLDLLELGEGGDLLVESQLEIESLHLELALLELERGGDLLVDSPSEGGHHTSSKHSWGQAFSKPTHTSFPVDRGNSGRDCSLFSKLHLCLHHVGRLKRFRFEENIIF